MKFLESEKENMPAYYKRMRKQMYEKVNSMAYDVLNILPTAENKKRMGLSVDCYWYAETGDYAGVRFSFDSKAKGIITIGKIYEIEKKLKSAHLNAGRQGLEDPTKKYFYL